ncbi:MAG: hypothetical protein JW874_12075 [Spirochaetales bacterium]|nr:hypothetical protein [Spirochaetales bacterium]
MKAFISLCRLMLRVFFGFSRFRRAKNWKQVLAMAGIALLLVYGIGSVMAAFISVNMANYIAFKPIGLEGLMVLNNLVLISLVSFVFGLITAMSVYFLSEAEIGFLALPLRPWQLFSAKMLVVYVSEVLISILILLPLLIIFGIKEQPPLQFYLFGLLGSLALPVVPICLMFFVIVPLVRVFRFLRRRSVMLLIAGVIGVAFMLVFQMYYQTNLMHISDPDWLRANYSGAESFLAGIGNVYPPAFMLWRAMSGTGLFEGISYLLALFAISAIVIALTFFVLARVYRDSLSGFNEVSLRRLRDAGAYIGKKFRRRELVGRLLEREIKLMNREPVYFFNGPFIILLLPGIMLVMYLFMGKTLSDQLGGKSLQDVLAEIAGMASFTVYIAGAVGGFLGSATLICATAFSRDAKFLAQIKALPISPVNYGMTKLLHGLLFGIAGIIVGTVPVLVLMKMPLWSSLLALLIACSMVWLLNIAALYLDTAFPRLKWDTTLAAFKNNPNALATVFGAMGFSALLGVAGYFLKISLPGYLLLYCLPMLGAAVLLTSKYPAFVTKRMALIEV